MRPNQALQLFDQPSIYTKAPDTQNKRKDLKIIPKDR